MRGRGETGARRRGSCATFGKHVRRPHLPPPPSASSNTRKKMPQPFMPKSILGHYVTASLERRREVRIIKAAAVNSYFEDVAGNLRPRQSLAR